MPNDHSRGQLNNNREANEYLTEAPYQDGTENPTKNAPNLPSKRLPLRNGPPRPYRMPNQEMPRSRYEMYTAAFREHERAAMLVGMTIYCEAYLLDTKQ
jgi:hypothetical protein